MFKRFKLLYSPLQQPAPLLRAEVSHANGWIGVADLKLELLEGDFDRPTLAGV